MNPKLFDKFCRRATGREVGRAFNACALASIEWHDYFWSHVFRGFPVGDAAANYLRHTHDLGDELTTRKVNL